MTVEQFLQLDNEQVALALERAFMVAISKPIGLFCYIAMMPDDAPNGNCYNRMDLMVSILDAELKFIWCQYWDVYNRYDYDDPGELRCYNELLVEIGPVVYRNSHEYSCLWGVYHCYVAEKLCEIQKLFKQLLRERYNP